VRAGSLPPGYTDPVRLGSGAWGQVWRVRQKALDRDVALKMQKGTDSLAEARRLASLRSAVLPEIFDAFSWRGRTCLAMEWLQGVSLERLLQVGALPEPGAWFLVREIACGLDDLHRQGLVHGDLKPANVMVLRDGSLREAPEAAPPGRARPPTCRPKPCSPTAPRWPATCGPWAS